MTEFEQYKKKYMEGLSVHPNPLVQRLMSARPAKRMKSADDDDDDVTPNIIWLLNKFVHSL